MQIISALNKIPGGHFKKPIITWGIFDGVHRGHQKIIKEAVNWAKKIKGTSVILTFRQHPREILQKGKPLFITSLEHRLLLFKQLGAAVCLVLPFTKLFSQTSAEDFIRHFLLAG
ncbi:MAG: adenylyltransferase/cytidyltransferase family protein, partial [Planctomycetota bacterium]